MGRKKPFAGRPGVREGGISQLVGWAGGRVAGTLVAPARFVKQRPGATLKPRPGLSLRTTRPLQELTEECMTKQSEVQDLTEQLRSSRRRTPADVPDDDDGTASVSLSADPGTDGSTKGSEDEDSTAALSRISSQPQSRTELHAQLRDLKAQLQQRDEELLTLRHMVEVCGAGPLRFLAVVERCAVSDQIFVHSARQASRLGALLIIRCTRRGPRSLGLVLYFGEYKIHPPGLCCGPV